LSHYARYIGVLSSTKSYPPEPGLRKKEVRCKGAFAQLAKHNALRFIDYTETNGSGKILGRKRTRR